MADEGVCRPQDKKNILIEILIDNNALQDLCLSTNHDTNLSRLLFLNKSNKLRLNFNLSPMFEQIVGANNQHFEKFKGLLSKFALLASSGFVAFPDLHLRTLIENSTTNEICAERDHWISVMTDIAAFKNYDAFHKQYSPLVDNLKLQLSKVSYSLPYNNWESFQKEIKNENSFVKALISRYKIGELTQGWSMEAITTAFPSIRFSVDAHLFYFRKLMCGRKPGSGDYIDLEQVIYLDVCDYFVTNDRGLRDTIERCGNKNLTGRTMKFSEFTQLISSDSILLTNCASRSHYL